MYKETTDIWFCAYLMHCGFKINKYIVISKGKVRCFFDLTDDQWMEYKLKFNNSELIKFKGLLEQIKDLGF